MLRCCGVPPPSVVLLRVSGGLRLNSATLESGLTQQRNTRFWTGSTTQHSRRLGHRMLRCCGGRSPSVALWLGSGGLRLKLRTATTECGVVAGLQRRVSCCCGFRGVWDSTAQHSILDRLNNATLAPARAPKVALLRISGHSATASIERRVARKVWRCCAGQTPARCGGPRHRSRAPTSRKPSPAAGAATARPATRIPPESPTQGSGPRWPRKREPWR